MPLLIALGACSSAEQDAADKQPPGSQPMVSNLSLRVSVDRVLSVPQECEIEFSIMIEGQPQPVSGRGRILSCSGTTFSIGLQFVQLSDAGKAVVARYMDSRDDFHA